jgi:hypothetical protein
VQRVEVGSTPLAACSRRDVAEQLLQQRYRESRAEQ